MKEFGGKENILICHPSINTFEINEKSDFILMGCKHI